MFLEKLRKRIGHFVNGLSHVEASQSSWNKLEKVKNVVIFANLDSPETVNVFKAFRKEIKQLCPSSKIAALLFVENKVQNKVAGISESGKVYVGEKDFGFFFKFLNEDISALLSTDYDIAINITPAQHIYIDFTFLYVRAHVKVGQRNTTKTNLNFIIDDETQSVDELCKYILQNLKMIF